MSWQTPLRLRPRLLRRRVHARDPCTYSTASPMAPEIAKAAAAASGASPRSSRARSTTSSGGSVRAVCSSCSTVVVVRAAAAASSSQPMLPSRSRALPHLDEARRGERELSVRREDLERRHPGAPVVDVVVVARDRQDLEVREQHELAVRADRQHARLVVRGRDLRRRSGSRSCARCAAGSRGLTHPARRGVRREVALPDGLGRRAWSQPARCPCARQVVQDLGDRAVLQLAADLTEQPLGTVGDPDPVGCAVRSRACSCSARVTENRMLRGNRRSSSRNSAALRALGTPR